MITDMFAGSNQSVNLSALISSINAGARVSQTNADDDESSKPLDFASLLSQTMDSCFSADPQLVALQGANKDSSQSSVSSISSSSLPKVSFNLDTYNSSPFINMSERNSFQSSFDAASSRDISQPKANLSSDTKDQTVSKETQKVEKEDSDNNVAKEASEKDENVQAQEETKVSEENEGETDVELSMAADSTEEAPVIEVAASTDEASEEIQVEVVSTEEPQIVEESTVKASEESENTEVVVEAAKVEETEAVVETAEVEEADDSEETEKEEVVETENINTEIFAQAQQNTAKVESEEEVEVVEEVEATDTENKVSEIKLAATEDTQEAETEDDDTKTKETAESDKLANAVSHQIKAHDNQKEEAVAAEETVVEAESQEVASNLNHQKKAEVSEEKVVEENTDSEAVEAAENSENSEKEVAKSDSKSEKESKFDEIVETLQKDDSVVPEESLRKEFARLTGQDSQTSSESADTATMDKTVVAMEQQAPQAAATADSTAEETADKIFAALTEKLDGVEGKSSKTQVVAGNAEGANKGFSMNQNNGSGMNNGFSFQSGSSQTYDASGKVAQPQSAPAMNFSELLTKAEMIKTKDGAKVMNIEVDQEGMGKLELELISKDGEVTARLSAESDMAKIKLEEIAPQIKENLQEKGVNLTQISVDVSSKNADDNRNEYQSFGKKNKSARLDRVGNRSTNEIIRENILPNLRRQALNIQSVDITV